MLNKLPQSFEFFHIYADTGESSTKVPYKATVEGDVVKVAVPSGNSVPYSVKHVLDHIRDGDWQLTTHRVTPVLPQAFQFETCAGQFEATVAKTDGEKFVHCGPNKFKYKEILSWFDEGSWKMVRGSKMELRFNKKRVTSTPKHNVREEVKQSNLCQEIILPGSGEEATLGVYRPDLNTRKVGKIRVELVDDGFPLALQEIARVMTWAQEAKGYKDHDWQNLPKAEQQLAAAASRHRQQHIIQRYVEGLAATECTDHESKIVHKAHEAFGVLAQLELLLRGKFDE